MTFPDHLMTLDGVEGRTNIDKGVWQIYLVIQGVVGESGGGMPQISQPPFWLYKQTDASPTEVQQLEG